MSTHAPCSPSSLYRRALCPASLGMETGEPDQPSEAATAGTALHALVSRILLARDGAEEIAAWQEVEALESFDADAVTFAVNLARKFKADHPQVLAEHALDLTWVHPLCGDGTCDLAFVRPFEHAVLFDWKFFTQVVEPAWANIQLAAYAVGVCRAYQVNAVECYLVQPHLRKVTRHTWEGADLEGVAERIRGIIRDAQEPTAALYPGWHCKYCKAAAKCPALAKAAAELPVKLAPVSLLPQDLARYLDMAGYIKEWCGKVEQHAYQVLQTGGRVPGYALKPGRAGNRAWTPDAEKGLLALVAELQRDVDLYEPKSLKSPAEIERAFGKSKAVTERLATLTTRSAPAMKLTKES